MDKKEIGLYFIWNQLTFSFFLLSWEYDSLCWQWPSDNRFSLDHFSNAVSWGRKAYGALMAGYLPPGPLQSLPLPPGLTEGLETIGVKSVLLGVGE